ncbi:MAG TPA: hypothetical protein VL985_11900 [Stellaceae bacterium]|nr:hypothetical protein [Stellaceae bacterium]
MRVGFVVAVMLATAAGCSVGAPDRASDIQNLNAIPDDISAVSMTRSEAQKVQDPNQPTVLPNHYEVPQE